jgi:hypothetical protein
MRRSQIQSQAAELFLKAAAYIRQYGWQEEGMGEYGQPRCSMGALDSACPRGEWQPEVAEVMFEELNHELHGMSLTQYNHKFHDGEKVAQLYEQAAQDLKRGGGFRQGMA